MRIAAVASLALAAGCQTYAQQQVALVPHATGMLTDGQPLDHVAQLGFGASNVFDPVAPTASAANGDYVPGTQLRADLALRLGKHAALWFAGEDGFASSAHSVSATLPFINSGADVLGGGAGLTVFVPTSIPRFKVALSSEVIFWNVPWVQYSTCTVGCNGLGITTADQGTTLVPTLAVDVTPSYRIGAFTVFAGVTLRNQPTVPAADTTDVADSADIQAGAFNVTLHGGLSYLVADAFKVMLSLQQTITSDPIAYGPSVAFMVRIPLGARSP
ncbi:MAG TPA: hypothetical protein VGG74_02480 [Kofleriaceae bacterium]|jgi:hypothetical protein